MKNSAYQDLLAKSEHQPVLIVFTATWSGSSQLLVNMLELARKDLGDVVIGELDVDEHDSLVSNIGIQQIPTTLIVYERVVVDLFTGPVSRSNLLRRAAAARQPASQA